MLWQGRRESENVEDARGSGGGGRIVLGGGIGTVILVVLYLLLGGDPQALVNSQQAQLPQSAQIDAFTSTSVFSVNSRNAWVQEAISQRPTSTPTKFGHHAQNLLGISDRVQ